MNPTLAVPNCSLDDNPSSTSSQTLATGELMEKARSQLISLTSHLNYSFTPTSQSLYEDCDGGGGAHKNLKDISSSSSTAAKKYPMLFSVDPKQQNNTTLEYDGTSSKMGEEALKWAQGLDNLLRDEEGVKSFTKFLKAENISDHSLMFIFACRGLKKRSSMPTSSNGKPLTSHATQEANNLLRRRIKAIYRSFLRSSGSSKDPSATTLPITGDCRKRIRDTINKYFYYPTAAASTVIATNLSSGNSNPADQLSSDLNADDNSEDKSLSSASLLLGDTVFDEALAQVELNLRRTTYQAFLKSDIYLSKLRGTDIAYDYKLQLGNVLNIVATTQNNNNMAAVIAKPSAATVALLQKADHSSNSLLSILPNDDTCHTFASVETPQHEGIMTEEISSQSNATTISSIHDNPSSLNPCETSRRDLFKAGTSYPLPLSYNRCGGIHVSDSAEATCEACVATSCLPTKHLPEPQIYLNNNNNLNGGTASYSAPSPNNNNNSYYNYNLPTLHEDSELEIESYCSGMAPSYSFPSTVPNNRSSECKPSSSSYYIENNLRNFLPPNLKNYSSDSSSSYVNIHRPTSLSAFTSSSSNTGSNAYHQISLSNKYSTNVVPSAVYLDSGGPASDFAVSNSETSGSEIFTDLNSNMAAATNTGLHRRLVSKTNTGNNGRNLLQNKPLIDPAAPQSSSFPHQLNTSSNNFGTRHHSESWHLIKEQQRLLVTNNIHKSDNNPKHPNSQKNASSSYPYVLGTNEKLEDIHIKDMAIKNSMQSDPLPFIPKMNQPANTMPPSDPVEFASILISKLNAVLTEKNKDIKLERSLKKLHLNNEEADDNGGDDESSQSILDDHVSRVWKDDNSPQPLHNNRGGGTNVIHSKIDQWLTHTQKYALNNNSCTNNLHQPLTNNEVAKTGITAMMKNSHLTTAYVVRVDGDGRRIVVDETNISATKMPMYPKQSTGQNQSAFPPHVPTTANQTASFHHQTNPQQPQNSSGGGLHPTNLGGLKRCSSASSGISSMIGGGGSSGWYNPNAYPWAPGPGTHATTGTGLKHNFTQNQEYATTGSACSSNVSSLGTTNRVAHQLQDSLLHHQQKHYYGGSGRGLNNSTNGDFTRRQNCQRVVVQQPAPSSSLALSQGKHITADFATAAAPPQDERSSEQQHPVYYSSDVGGCPSQACTNFTVSSSGGTSNYYYETSSAFVSEFDEDHGATKQHQQHSSYNPLSSSLHGHGPGGPECIYPYSYPADAARNGAHLSIPPITAADALEEPIDEEEDSDDDGDAILSRNLAKISADKDYSCYTQNNHHHEEQQQQHLFVSGRNASFNNHDHDDQNIEIRRWKTTTQQQQQVSLNTGSSNVDNDVIHKQLFSSKTVIGYYFCNEPVPYRTKITGTNVTLKQFKSLLSKKGKYRYFFKTSSDEFQTGGVINEEISDDEQVLPLWEGKIFAKVEAIE